MSTPKSDRQLGRINRSLPLGWKALTLENGRVYYVNYVTRKSQWYPPPAQWRSKENLPYGWEKAQDQYGSTYYISHLLQITTSEKPLLSYRKKTSLTNTKHKEMRQRTFTEGKLRVRFERAVDIKHFEDSNAAQETERLPRVDGIFRVHLYSEHISSSFKISQKLTIEAITLTLCKRFEIRPENRRYFAIMRKEGPINYLYFVIPQTNIHDLTQKVRYDSSDFYFRMAFIPTDLEALRQTDANTYNYLFHQTRMDIKDGRFAQEMDLDIAIDIGIVLHQYHFKMNDDRCQTKGKSKSKLEKEVDLKILENIIPIKRLKVKDFKWRCRRTLGQVQDLSCEDLKSYVMTLCGNIRNFGGQYYKLNSSSDKIVKLLIGRNCGISEIVQSNYRSMNRLAWFQQVTSIIVKPTGKLSYQIEIHLNPDEMFTFSATKAVTQDVARMIDGYCQIINNNTISVTKYEVNAKFPQSIIQETQAPIPGYHGSHCLFPEFWSYVHSTENNDETYTTNFKELPTFTFEALSQTVQLPKRHPTYPPPEHSIDDVDIINSQGANFKMTMDSRSGSSDTLDMDISTPSSSTSSPVSPLLLHIQHGHEIPLNSDLSPSQTSQTNDVESNSELSTSPKVYTSTTISTEEVQDNVNDTARKRQNMELPSCLSTTLNILPSPLASPAPGKPFEYKDLVLPPPSPFADQQQSKIEKSIQTTIYNVADSDDEVYL
ncbi:uncharacterized protein TRIADDRAFT_62220 [Trichoplax adhaerens]|uniref:FERM domain-containing protein n=1 Tax=Trichoplax adhaerens TaxID=10228 RepID=B3SD62_TRIAD|nr:hypothetical protein TRIADDRAFT_62220 [Trichoplax adhaerens]EDV19324.1 hypothetical protein TRIADDRAFT_62220 [Trichoplax adhaerens]|eukprot:XP_002118175.1 hypothetical protein TRIADDRAFT_62220 [Trichoplax adhaerens]